MLERQALLQLGEDPSLIDRDYDHNRYLLEKAMDIEIQDEPPFSDML